MGRTVMKKEVEDLLGCNITQEQYARSLSFSRETADLCGTPRNMEKEHPTKSQGAQHITIL